jgi:hypothetical protein
MEQEPLDGEPYLASFEMTTQSWKRRKVFHIALGAGNGAGPEGSYFHAQKVDRLFAVILTGD